MGVGALQLIISRIVSPPGVLPLLFKKEVSHNSFFSVISSDVIHIRRTIVKMMPALAS